MKKLILILLALLLLCGCSSKKPETADIRDPQTYISLIRNYEPREKTGKDELNPAFEEFLDKVFKTTMSEDYTSLHFDVTDYKAMGLEKPEVTLGEVTYEFDEEYFQKYYDMLTELQSFDYSTLSKRQQYDYEAFEYSLYETLASMGFWQYSQCMTMNNCVPEDLVTIFSDFTFYDAESVEDYIVLVEDIERYLNDSMTYTEAQIKDGIKISDDSVDYVIEFAERFTSKREDNVLITSFDERIDALDFLSEDEKESYKEKNRELILNSVIPVYEKVPQFISQYYGTAKTEELILSNMNKDYAELYYILQTSSNASAEEIWEMLKDSLAMRVDALYEAISTEEGYNTVFGAIDEPQGVMDLGFRETLSFLEESTPAYFPDLGDIEYDVQELDATAAAGTVKAYYWTAPLDNVNQNIIRVNPNTETGLDTFITLAHEGLPGHLYQACFYNKTNPNPARRTIGFVGYTEGYANYIQVFPPMMAGMSEKEAIAVEYINSYYFDLYSIIDMGVNLFGWNSDDIEKYLNETDTVFSFGDGIGEIFYNFLTSMPGTYCRYAVGSAQIKALRDLAKAELGDSFDYVEFHRSILENGPLPFAILEGAVADYIVSAK